MSYKVFLLNNQVIEKEGFISDDDLEIGTYETIFSIGFKSELEAEEFYDKVSEDLEDGYSIVLFYEEKERVLNLRQNHNPKEIETRNDFEQYLQIERNRFIREVKEQNWNSNLRVTAEDLIIAYDQMFQKIKRENLSQNATGVFEDIDYLFSKINWKESSLDSKAIGIMNNLKTDIQNEIENG